MKKLKHFNEKTKLTIMAILTVIVVVGSMLIYTDRIQKISNGEMTIQHNEE